MKCFLPFVSSRLTQTTLYRTHVVHTRTTNETHQSSLRLNWIFMIFANVIHSPYIYSYFPHETIKQTKSQQQLLVSVCQVAVYYRSFVVHTMYLEKWSLSIPDA